MKYPDKWQQLVSIDDVVEVMPSRSFHHNQADYLQFINSDGKEHIAIHNRHPYGDIDVAAVPDSLQKHLLQAEGSGDDYTVFSVPEDMLTLPQATFGTGKANVRKLRAPFHEVGHVVGQLIAELPAPQLTVSDFAINRETGEPVLLPPVELGTGSTDRLIQIDSIAESIAAMLSPYLTAAVYGELINEVAAGVQE